MLQRQTFLTPNFGLRFAFAIQDFLAINKLLLYNFHQHKLAKKEHGSDSRRFLNLLRLDLLNF